MRRTEFHRGFSAAHRIWNDDSPCRNIHGHNYTVAVYLETEDEMLNDQGFVVSFDSIKAHIDAFDHTLILDEHDPLVERLAMFTDTGGLDGTLAIRTIDGQPSTENLADYLAVQIAGVTNAKAPGFSGHVRVKLTEGPSIVAWGEAWFASGGTR